MTFLLCSVQLGTTKHSEMIFLASRKTLPAEVAHDEACSCGEQSLDSQSLADADTGLLPSVSNNLCFPLLLCQLWTETCQQLQYTHKRKSKGLHSPLSPKQLFTNVLLFTMFNILKYLQVNILSDAENPECLQLVGLEAHGGSNMANEPSPWPSRGWTLEG